MISISLSLSLSLSAFCLSLLLISPLLSLSPTQPLLYLHAPSIFSSCYQDSHRDGRRSSMAKMWNMFSGKLSGSSESILLVQQCLFEHFCVGLQGKCIMLCIRSSGSVFRISIFICCYLFLNHGPPIDIGALQKEVSALEELSRQLFLEYVDMHGVKVHLYMYMYMYM